MQAQRLERDLRGLVAPARDDRRRPVAGRGGFELLYWVPFLRWFAERFRAGAGPPAGGVAGRHRLVVPALCRRLPRDLRLRDARRSSARCTTSASRPTASRSRRGCWSSSTGCCARLTEDVEHRTMLHPSSMYRLFSPFWWGHLDERWVHAACVLRAADAGRGAAACRCPTAPVHRGEVLLQRVLSRRRRRTAPSPAASSATCCAQGPVVSLDHRPAPRRSRRRRAAGSRRPAAAASTSTRARTSRCRRRSSPAPGPSSAPTAGSRIWRRLPACATTAYYSNASGFSPRHLLMAQSALASMGAPGAA